MTIEEIKNKLKKRATIFETGGFRPTKELYESWIGRVGYCLQSEILPVDSDGKPMYPVAMFFPSKLPYIPKPLVGIELLSIFFSEKIYDHLVDESFEGYFLIREYRTLDGLQPCEFTSKHMKCFPLVAKLVENDYPVWDGCDIPRDIEEEILRLEDGEGIEYFEDIYECCYPMHKFGGYGSFCQSGVNFGNNYEFVMQISSDSKACYNIVDSGSFYCYKNINTGEWKLHCDFY